jgi:hypothetical protein
LSVHSIAGLVLLNLLLLGVGVGLMWGVRGWRSWSDLARLAGVAYLVGMAAEGVAFVVELVAGLHLSLATILATAAILAAGGGLAGVLQGRRLPDRPRLRLPAISLTTAVFASLTAVYFEALFRAGRLAGLYEFDAWGFWVPKAKAIYFFGGLDQQFFRELSGPSYPPLVPALEAAAFHFMGSADVVTLHLQFWFLFVGFVAAVVGLLSTRVPTLLLWPPVLLVLVTPHVLGYALQVQADFLLDELFALAGLLLALWLLDREWWQLACAGVLLAGAMSTKREGYLFAACLLIAAAATSVREARSLWPSLALAGVGAAALTVPWRILLAARDIAGGGPESGGVGLFSNLDRAWPSMKLALSALFDFQIWLIAAPLAVSAAALAFMAGARRIAVYGGLVYLLLVAGFTWITWSFPTLPITKHAALNPIVRATGSLVLLSAALVPLMLAAARSRLAARRTPV